VDEGPLTDEYYFDEGSLIVKGKLKGIKGVAFYGWRSSLHGI